MIAGVMARKLKTYQTSLGFFDQAIAAPSMKAALEAWGADSNLFHQGAAKESKDRDVVAATMAKPGVILRRPVGSDGPFTEDAALPTNFGQDHAAGDRQKRHAKPKKQPARKLNNKVDDKAARKAALEYEKAEKRRESERRKEEAARAKEQQRRDAATAKAKAALEKAEQEHERIANAIEGERAALEERSQAEDARWEKLSRKLNLALRQARQ
jgi:colicin import membrane protein